MGERVMIIGASGSGKSRSYEGFESDEVRIFNVAGKRPPFRKKLATMNRPNYAQICAALADNNARAYIIDDSTYLMQFAMFEHARERGYEKFTEMALDFEKLLQAASMTDDDTIVYFLHHPQFNDDGKAKPQTVGKMLDNQLNIEGLFRLCWNAPCETANTFSLRKTTATTLRKRQRACFRARLSRTT